MHLIPRRAGARTVGALTVLAGGFVLLHLPAPSWARAVGLDVWEFQNELASRQEADRRHRELDDVMNQLSRQIGASQVVIDELIDGRITLESAVEQIGQINEDRPGFDRVLETIYPSARDRRERLGRYTIARIRSVLEGEPSRLTAVLGRLDGEYQDFTRER
jgi:hypothetical protein